MSDWLLNKLFVLPNSYFKSWSLFSHFGRNNILLILLKRLFPQSIQSTNNNTISLSILSFLAFYSTTFLIYSVLIPLVEMSNPGLWEIKWLTNVGRLRFRPVLVITVITANLCLFFFFLYCMLDCYISGYFCLRALGSFLTWQNVFAFYRQG